MKYPAIIPDLDINEYHSGPGISRSSLVAFKRSPLHYWHEHINPDYVRPKPTEEMIFGNAVHSAILEGDKFWERYIVRDKPDMRTKLGKETRAADLMEAGDRIILTTEQYERICQMENAIAKHPMAIGLIMGAQCELSLFWQDEATGILCKARPDIWHTTFVGDLKTTADASYKSFSRSVFQYNYHLQCAMIYEGILAADGHRVSDFAMIAIEKEPPYAIACYRLDDAIIEKGREEFHNLLGNLANCLTADEWPSYDDQVINLPEWI